MPSGLATNLAPFEAICFPFSNFVSGDAFKVIMHIGYNDLRSKTMILSKTPVCGSNTTAPANSFFDVLCFDGITNLPCAMCRMNISTTLDECIVSSILHPT